MDSELARQEATGLWTKLTGAISTAIDRRFDRRKVVEIDANGDVWVASLNPAVDDRRKAPRLRGMRVEVGDDVLLVTFGGTPTIIGVVRMSGDTGSEADRIYTAQEVDTLLALSRPISAEISGNPGSASTTVVTTAYASMTPLTATNLMLLFNDTTLSGRWDIEISAYATVYRSVTTGGVYLAVGDTVDASVALGRNFPQNSGYTLNVSRVLKNKLPTDTFDLRYAGFTTAGSTNCVTYGALVTATRRA